MTLCGRGGRAAEKTLGARGNGGGEREQHIGKNEALKVALDAAPKIRTL